MHNDSVQSMEYTITTPLFSAILLVFVSPTVPTGMVQWLFACLLVSHTLCIPILYLSKGLQVHLSLEVAVAGVAIKGQPELKHGALGPQDVHPRLLLMHVLQHVLLCG